MEKHACPEHTRLKERETQCGETSEYFRQHSEYGELLSKKASRRYWERHLEARQERLDHAKRCPVCKGTADEWT